MGLNLGDVGHLVLNRILNGDDLANPVVGLLQGGVERSGLAGAGGAGDQDDAVAGAEPASEQLQVIRLHAQVLELQVLPLLGQQPQHHRLPEGAGHGGDPHVHFPAGDAGGDTPILGQAAFGDVDAGNELDARSDCWEALNRLGEPGVQHPIDPQAHGEILLARLHVDVGRLHVHGLGKQVVDQLDHRRLFRHLAQLLGVVAGEQALDGLLLAHEVQQPVDLVVGGEMKGDRLVGIEVVERLEQGVIEHVPGDALQFIVHPPQQHGPVEEPLQLDG